MKLVANPTLRPRARQEMHAMLWSIYLGRADSRPDGPPSLTDALAGLHSLWRRTRRKPVGKLWTIVATALWSVLPRYNGTRPPDEFADLLRDVLGMDVDRARELVAQREYEAFPPLSRTLMKVSRFDLLPRRKGVAATLDLRIERDFDQLSRLIYPTEWPKICPLFWSGMRERRNGWGGRLRTLLAGDTIPIVLEKTDVFEVQPLRTKAELRFKPSPEIVEGRMYFEMTPDDANPGWTRLQHTREVTFGPGAQLPRPYQEPTLAYWTKSEVACLALK